MNDIFRIKCPFMSRSLFVRPECGNFRKKNTTKSHACNSDVLLLRKFYPVTRCRLKKFQIPEQDSRQTRNRLIRYCTHFKHSRKTVIYIAKNEHGNQVSSICYVGTVAEARVATTSNAEYLDSKDSTSSPDNMIDRQLE
jgi:hypothetical protein